MAVDSKGFNFEPNRVTEIAYGVFAVSYTFRGIGRGNLYLNLIFAFYGRCH